MIDTDDNDGDRRKEILDVISMIVVDSASNNNNQHCILGR